MSYSSEVLADSPKAYYRMQEASGLIQDSSGMASPHHASSSTGTFTYQVGCPISSEPTDRAIYFTGLGGFSIPDHADLDMGDTLTAEAWIYKSDVGITRAISGRGTGALTWGAYTDNTLFAACADVGVICFSTVTFSIDTWYHVAYTKDTTTSKIYVNGVDRTGTVTNQVLANTATPLIVGADYTNTSAQWYGSLDEVAFYSTALSQARIQAHYAAATGAGVGTVRARTAQAGLRW